MKLIIAIFIILNNFSVFAAQEPEDEATIQCVQEQLKIQDPQLRDVLFNDDPLVFMHDKQNFDYIFVSDDELQTLVTVITRGGDYQESTRWINGMFPININISICFKENN